MYNVYRASNFAIFGTTGKNHHFHRQKLKLLFQLLSRFISPVHSAAIFAIFSQFLSTFIFCKNLKPQFRRTI
jgi:hypothetical protein